MFHLLVDITAHGFGHVSQTTAVINALAQLKPDLQLTVRTAAPHAFLASRLQCGFAHIPQAFDFGMKMHNAVDVDVQASMAAYREAHAGWPATVADEAAVMRQLKPDLLLANVPYLSLAAARLAGVPAVGMCCLNWADIYRHYCAGDPASPRIHRQMLDAYLSADCFLKVAPAMPMPDFTHARSIPPIVRLGASCRDMLDQQFSIAPDTKLVMVAMGGMEFRLPVPDWPCLPGVRWIIPQAWGAQRQDMIAFEAIGQHFTDVLASCDAVITKPGYGMFTEAAYAGVPVLYLTRQDWPEEPFLVDWLQHNGSCLEVDREQLHAGELGESLQQLWSRAMPPLPTGDGALVAASFLVQTYF